MTTNIQNIESIGIVGGGTAGYFAALYLKKIFPEKTITLIESSKFPVIGVGEATTTYMTKFLHHDLEFEVKDFFVQAKPTIKSGIRFEWGLPGDYHFNFPFAGVNDSFSCMHFTKDPNNINVISMLMKERKAPFIRKNNEIKPLPIKEAFAYHIDNNLLLNYLKKKAKEFDIHHKNASIKKVNVEHGIIQSLETEEGEIFKFDLYIDCSGYKSLLLEKSLGIPFVDYSKSLITNRAVIGVKKHEGKIKPYTTATTMKHGWMWNIPTQQEDHLGYVYSSNFCSDDEAFEELRKNAHDIENGKVINFRSGRHKEAWVNNVVAIGNSYGFVEPLESTGIHMIIYHIKHLAKALASSDSLTDSKSKYNLRINDSWDTIKKFITLHFKLNKKISSPFWEYCNNQIDSSEIEEYLDYFKEHGPVSFNPDSSLYKKMRSQYIFKPISFDALTIGFSETGNYWNKEQEVFDKNWPKEHIKNKLIVQNSIYYEDSIAFLESDASNYISKWYKNKMEKNYHKTKSVRELGEFDIAPLLNMLPALKEEWDKKEDYIINHNKLYSLSQVNHVNFRWSNKQQEPVEYFDLPLWEKYKNILLPIMIKAVQPIGYKKGYFPRVMFAKMLPGTIIPEHIDGNSKGWVAHKIHIPLITNPQVLFSVRGVEYHFVKGKAYEVDNSGMHGVKNEGNTTRIHLIFEYLDAEINDVPHADFSL